MADPVTLMLLERAIERIVLAVFSGVALILGYQLFKLGIINQQRGELAWGKLSVKLLNVGPGVFFALFGTVVFGILAFRPVVIDSDHIHGVLLSPSHTSYGNPNEKSQLASISDEDAKSINTVVDLVDGREFNPTLGGLQKQALDKALKGLKLLRKSAAYQRYPRVARKFEDWSGNAALNPKFVDSLSEQDRQDYLAMKAFLKNSYLEENLP